MGILEFLDSIDASARKPRDIYAMPPRADAPRSPAPDPYAFGDLTSETARRAYADMLALAGMGCISRRMRGSRGRIGMR